MKYKYIVIFIVAIAIIMIAVATSIINKKSKENEEMIRAYREYLLTLSAEEVIMEDFNASNDNNILKMREVMAERYRALIKKDYNLKFARIIEISFNELGSKSLEEFVRERYGDDAEGKLYNVTYEIQYKRSGPQNSGIHVWGYFMIRKNMEEPWFIESHGDAAGFPG